jgi:hypothetical protein
MEVQPVGPGQFDEVYPLLLEFGNPRMSRDDWRRMLFDVPWPVDETCRGWVLRDGGAAVGYLGGIFSARTVGGERRRFCNLSSWIVRASHRSASLQLLGPALALRSHTIVNLSPSPTAYEVFRAFGFEVLERAQRLAIPVAGPRTAWAWARGRVWTAPEAVRTRLEPAARTVFDDMRGTLARQVLVEDRGRQCHVVATRGPWKRGLSLAQIAHASDWELFWRHAPRLNAALFRVLGTVGLRVDARWATGRHPAFSTERALPQPHLFRPASPDITPERVDGLYSELMGQRW